MPYHCSPRYARRSAAPFSPFGGLEILGGLISAFDENNSGNNKSAPCALPIARPNFDVYETKDSYVLEAELPGVSDKKSITLEFTDAQTLSVKGVVGRAPRKSEESKEKESPLPTEKTDTEMSDATTLDNEPLIEGLVRKGSPAPSYQATVEDDVEDDKSDFEVVNTPRTNTPAPPQQVPGGPAADEKTKEEPAAPANSEETAKEQRKRRCAGTGRKYWVSERSTGAFHRTFSFAGLVDQEAVKASLENGLLTVVVPKRKPYVARVNIE